MSLERSSQQEQKLPSKLQIIPKDYMQDSLESYIYKRTTRSQIIYITVLAALIACIVALPFIFVEVTVQNAGMIRPVNERTELRASVAELVDSVYVKEGTNIQAGDTIIRFRTDNLFARKVLVEQKMK